MNILLTGVGGFIGAHCLEYFLDNTDWFITGIDSWRHKGTHRRIEDVVSPQKLEQYKDRYVLLKHDLSVPLSRELINLIHENGYIDIIINLASESAVERSIYNPVDCLINNYNLMINMLEYARKYIPKLFIQVSSDETYGQAQPGEFHKEWSPTVPNNPYSSSKAAQEALAIGYWRTYNLPIIITNTVNNFGEGQDLEKFIPKIIQYVVKEQVMPIYGDSILDIGSRYYLHAKNHADAFVFLSKFKPTLYDSGKNILPDRYNIGSNTEMNNFEVAQLIASIIGKELKYEFIKHEKARAGYDRRYAIDDSKIRNLGWKPPIDFNEGIKNVVQWTLQHKNWI